MVAEGGEEVEPLGNGEALAAAVGVDGVGGEEQLPGADVQHAVAAGVDQRDPPVAGLGVGGQPDDGDLDVRQSDALA